MRHFSPTFLRGLGYAAQPWLVLPLYLIGLALGLLQGWPAVWAGHAGTLHEPLALGDSEALLRLLLAGRSLGPGVALWVLLTLVAVLCYASTYNLVSGGALSRFTGRRSFRNGATRYFWSFTGLGLLLLLLSLLALVVATVSGKFAGLNVGLISALVLLQLINLIGEYGRALVVTTDRRNPLVALGGATRFIGRHLPGVVALAVLGLLLHWGVQAFVGAFDQRVGYAAPLVQQTAALAWVWIKQLRLGWALAYIEEATGYVRLSTSS